MADEVVVKTNIPDFKSQLEKFGREFQQKTVRFATAGATAVFKKAVIEQAPVLNLSATSVGPRNSAGVGRHRRAAGVLKRSIYAKRTSRSTGVESYVVSFRKQKRSGGDPFYGKFLEGGWVPRGPGRRLKGGAKFRAHQRRTSSATLITKYKFLQPAFARAKEKALEVFNQRMRARLDKGPK